MGGNEIQVLKTAVAGHIRTSWNGPIDSFSCVLVPSKGSFNPSKKDIVIKGELKLLENFHLC